jgi:carbon monoxide dehydrogenase subunit G
MSNRTWLPRIGHEFVKRSSMDIIANPSQASETMVTYETSVLIAAQPDAVWRVLSDVVHWPQWTPTVLKVEPLGPHELTVGYQFRVHQPRLRPAIWTVTLVEPPIRFVWISHAMGFVVLVGDHVLESMPNHCTRLTLKFGICGFMSSIIGRMSRSLVEKAISQEAESLANYFDRENESDHNAAKPV